MTNKNDKIKHARVNTGMKIVLEEFLYADVFHSLKYSFDVVFL